MNNDENQLFIIGETEVADVYLGEFMRMFDHYYFRVLQAKADASDKPIQLKKVPKTGQKTWWDEDFTNPRKILDRELFA